jgi:uncharacterized membrane protein
MDILKLGFASTLAALIALNGYRKKSLSLSGAYTAFIIGFVTILSGYMFGTILLAFYFIGSKATKVALRFGSD